MLIKIIELSANMSQAIHTFNNLFNLKYYKESMKYMIETVCPIKLGKSWLQKNRVSSTKQYPHSLHKEVSFQYNQCEYTATCQSSLYRHIDIVHEWEIYIFICNQCGYKAITQDNLTWHIQFLHEGVRFFL